MDAGTGDIRAAEFTSSREGDSPMLPGLLDQIPPDDQIGTVTGDGAFDTRRCHTAILDRGGTAVIPIRKNGRLWKEDCPAARARNDIPRASKRFGRANWKHWSPLWIVADPPWHTDAVGAVTSSTSIGLAPCMDTTSKFAETANYNAVAWAADP